MWIWGKLYLTDSFLFIDHSLIDLPLTKKEKFYVSKRWLSLGLISSFLLLKYNIKSSKKQKDYQGVYFHLRCCEHF